MFFFFRNLIFFKLTQSKIYFVNFYFNIYHNFYNFFVNNIFFFFKKNNLVNNVYLLSKQKHIYFFKFLKFKNLCFENIFFKNTTSKKKTYINKFKLLSFYFFFNFKKIFYKTKLLKNFTFNSKYFVFILFFKFYFLSFYFLNFFLKNFLFHKSKIKYKIKFKHKFKNVYKHFYKNINFFYNKNINFNIYYSNYIINNNKIDKFNFNPIFLKSFNNIYNNQYPLLIFSNNSKILNKFNLKKSFFFLNLFNVFILNFFEFFFKFNFFIKLSNDLSVNNNFNMLTFFNKNSVYFRNYKFFNFSEMVEIVLISFLNKDLIFFKNWLKITLDDMNVKNHKKFFVILSDFVSDNFNYFSNNFKILGFYFIVRGKIGLSGNAKKKRFYFKKGLINVSSKKSKIDFQKFNIKTNCGSLGINIIISY